MNSENNGFGFWDLLAMMSFIVQVVSYQEIKSQASTDDIFSELQKQDREYLSQILRNQEAILEKLSDLSGTN